MRNRILPILLNKAVPDNTLCLLVREEERVKALNVIHGEMFERPKRVHLAIIGHGRVGGALIEQIISQRAQLKEQKNIDLCHCQFSTVASFSYRHRSGLARGIETVGSRE